LSSSAVDLFDDDTDQVTHRVHQVRICLAVGGRGAGRRQVGGHVVYCRLQAVEQIVEPVDVGYRHDALSVWDVELARPSPGLVSPLAVRGAAEQPGPTGTRSYVERSATPSAPLPFRGRCHPPTVRRASRSGG